MTPEQAGDVGFIERRLLENKKPGVLLTNGTGTGKTFSGLGAVKSALDRGEKHILITAPSDKVVNDWIDAARDFFGIKDAVQLTSTKNNGKTARVVVTTHANLGQNDSLVHRPWAMLVADEAHHLSQSSQGNRTEALDTFRALTWHPKGLTRRVTMLEPDATAELQSLRAIERKNRFLTPDQHAKRAAAQAKIDAANKKVLAEAEKRGEANRPKALLLSATPFAYHFSLDYGEGYLFDFPADPPSRGYNTPSGRSAFYMDNFGYRMRYGKLTKPENPVATGILERQFAERLSKSGAMSGRALVVPHDYSRDFALTESTLGQKIDEIMSAIQENPRLRPLLKKMGVGDYLNRRFLLEALKAREAVERIKDHLKLGRKVVVFHDYKLGGVGNPIRPIIHPSETDTIYGANGPETVNLSEAYESLRRSIPDFDDTADQLDSLHAPLSILPEHFPDMGIFNGDVPAKRRREVINEFNKSRSKMNVILVQRASGKEGISLHDRDDKHQRVFIDLGIPGRPTDAIQSEGRIYRHGVKSDAIMEYLVTGTNFERWTFAQTIAQRASTAENLAMGERARSLLQSFADGFNDASTGKPGPHQGKGGKAMDRARETVNPYDQAVALYYTNQKKTSRTKAREGIDYFPTPEPLGFKMVEWSAARPGERMLEPSAGHGAIARFFPDSTTRHAVEPSNELAGKLALNATDTEVHQVRFEDYHLVNKFDTITMNPPWGVGGKVAMEHLAKAALHLKEGGRIVALIPRGQMDERLNRWMDSDAAKGIHQVAEILFPPVTFERAGTNVSARVVVLDRVPEGQYPKGNVTRDLSDAADIKELFERLRERSVPDRPEQPVQKVPLPNRDSVIPASLESPARNLPQPAAMGNFVPADFLHTKNRTPVYVAKAARRLSEQEFSAARSKAKLHGGYYSAFKGDGAIPGFHFKTVESRDAFLGTNITKPIQAASPRAYADAADKLNEETKPTPMGRATPLNRAEIIRAYRQLTRTHGPDVPIADVMEQAGFALSDPIAKGILRDLNRTGDVTSLTSGDWSAADDRTRAWGIRTQPGERPNLLMRMGGQALAASSPDTQTTQDVKGMAPGRPDYPGFAEKLTRDAAAAKEGIANKIDAALAGVKAIGTAIKAHVMDRPQVTSFDRAVGEWLGAGDGKSEYATGHQKADLEAKRLAGAIDEKFSPAAQEGMTIFRQANGDESTLRAQLAALDAGNPHERGFVPAWKRALDLTPEEKAMAKKAGDFYGDYGQLGEDTDLLGNLLDNYVQQEWDLSNLSPADQESAKQKLGPLRTKFDYSQKRKLGSYFEGIQAGYTPKTLRLGKLMAAYAQQFNHVASDRQFLWEALPAVEASDGRPAVTTSGFAKAVTGPKPKVLVNPKARMPVRVGDTKEPTRDYVFINHPAVVNAKWAGDDTAGNPVILTGDLLVHPEFAAKLRNMLMPSALAKTPIVRQLRTANRFLKNSILEASAFHLVHLATHGLGHGVVPWKLPEVDMTDPLTRDLVNAGLMLAPGYNARAELMEGLASQGGILSHLPFIGPMLEKLTAYQFEDLFPRMSQAMGHLAFDRNTKRYPNLTRDQVLRLTAKQCNDSFGLSNDRFEGQNPTANDVARMTFFAWDFLKHRIRYISDAFTTKHGGEQRRAIFLIALGMMVLAKTIERMLTGKNQFDKPFSVIDGSREYVMRSIPGDFWAMLTEPRRFINGRLSPLISRPILEALTGRDYRGVKRSPVEQLEDLAKSGVAIPLKGLLPGQETGLGAAVASASGVTVKRHSDLTDMAKKGRDWQVKNGTANPDEAFPPSKYLPLRYALEDGDRAKAQKAFTELASQIGTQKVLDGFKASVMRPFGGSAANEPKFLASLSASDRQTYRAAQIKREAMVRTLTSIAESVPRVASKVDNRTKTTNRLPMFTGF